MTQPLYTVRQLAYVTPNLDATLKYWVDVLHVGPFYVYEHVPIENQRYRDQPTDVDLTIALGNTGSIQIELMMQNNDTPSIYREFLDAGGVGVHHFGLMPPDYQAAYDQYKGLGHEPAFELTLGETRVVYFDTVQTIGHFTELWENTPALNEFFMLVENAAKGWDGKDPIRQGEM